MNALRIMLLCAGLWAMPVLAQETDTNRPPETRAGYTNRAEFWQAVETTRSNCIQNRRIICGRIVRMLPGGLVVDSGYTNLMRQPLESSWLIPGTAEARREPNLVERNEPDCPCIGLVYLTDLPKSRRAKPKLYDYVVLEGFPAGHFTYKSVGTVQHTVRHYSANLAVAVRTDVKAAAPLIK